MHVTKKEYLFIFTGRKIEVKIITAGYYDDEDNTMHILSDTESREFNKMIVTILVSYQLHAAIFHFPTASRLNISFIVHAHAHKFITLDY